MSATAAKSETRVGDRVRIGDRIQFRAGDSVVECVVRSVSDTRIVPEGLRLFSGVASDGRNVGGYFDHVIALVCPHCNGTRERFRFSRSRWGDESDPCARKEPCDRCVEGWVRA
jgi:hypothetical protein